MFKTGRNTIGNITVNVHLPQSELDTLYFVDPYDETTRYTAQEAVHIALAASHDGALEHLHTIDVGRAGLWTTRTLLGIALSEEDDLLEEDVHELFLSAAPLQTLCLPKPALTSDWVTALMQDELARLQARRAPHATAILNDTATQHDYAQLTFLDTLITTLHTHLGASHA